MEADCRGGSRIYKGGGGGLTQGTDLLGRGAKHTSQHVKHAGTRGVWGHAPQEMLKNRY